MRVKQMRFKIYFGYLNKESNCYENEDYIVVEGDTIEEVREIAYKETAKRGATGLYSEEI